jgi:hypothetical protein
MQPVQEVKGAPKMDPAHSTYAASAVREPMLGQPEHQHLQSI